MASSSIFGGPAAAGGGDKPLVVRLGKMTMAGKLVTADARKGKVTLSKDSTGLLQMVWRDRVTERGDDPIILFPNDAQFFKCKSCRDGRVIYLKFSTGRREFYWLQEPDASGDDAILAALNAAINGPSSTDAARSAGAGTEAGASAAAAAAAAAAQPLTLADVVDEGTLELLQQLPAAERLEFAIGLGLADNIIGELMALGLPSDDGNDDDDVDAGPLSPAAAPTPAAPPALTRTGATTSAAAAAAAAAAPTSAASQAPFEFDAAQLQSVMLGAQGPDLTDLLALDVLEPLLAHPDVVQSLLPFLPEGQASSVDDLRRNLRSPQYQQALGVFNHALKSGQLQSLIGQLGVDPALVAQGGGGIRGLLHALQQQADKTASNGATPMDETQ